MKFENRKKVIPIILSVFVIVGIVVLVTKGIRYMDRRSLLLSEYNLILDEELQLLKRDLKKPEKNLLKYTMSKINRAKKESNLNDFEDEMKNYRNIVNSIPTVTDISEVKIGKEYVELPQSGQYKEITRGTGYVGFHYINNSKFDDSYAGTKEENVIRPGVYDFYFENGVEIYLIDKRGGAKKSRNYSLTIFPGDKCVKNRVDGNEAGYTCTFSAGESLKNVTLESGQLKVEDKPSVFGLETLLFTITPSNESVEKKVAVEISFKENDVEVIEIMNLEEEVCYIDKSSRTSANCDDLRFYEKLLNG